jgi:hypothetical protein
MIWLETDRMIPTLPTPACLCRVFGVGPKLLFCRRGEAFPSITRKLRETGHARKHELLKQFPLSVGADSRFLAREVDFPPGVVGVLTKAGKAFSGVVYVLEGSLQLDSAGQQDVLETGDCLCLHSDMLITWGASGTSRCRALVVTPGQTDGDVAIL